MLKIIAAAVPPATLAFSPDPDLSAGPPARAPLLRSETLGPVLEALGKMASSVAHELNNLTTVIQGHTRLLLHASGAKPDSIPSLVQIEAATERAAALAQQLRLFGNETVVQTLPVDLNAFVLSRRLLIEKQLGPNRSLELELAPEPVSIEGDVEILEQIIRDLPLFTGQALTAGESLVIGTRLVSPAPKAIHPARPVEVCLAISGRPGGLNASILESLFLPSGGRKGLAGFGLATIFAGVIQHRGRVEVHWDSAAACRLQIYWPTI